MGRAITVSVGPVSAASANNISLSQSLAGAGALLLNGSTGGVLDASRRLQIHSNGNDSALTWTVTGLTGNNQTVAETLAGGNGASVTTALDYAVVTSIKGSAATASTVTAGTSAGPPLASSRWVRLDEWGPGPTVISTLISGSATYSLESSQDDPNSLIVAIPPYKMNWQTGLFMPAWVNSTTSETNVLTAAPLWFRVTLISGTGSVSATITQMGPP